MLIDFNLCLFSGDARQGEGDAGEWGERKSGKEEHLLGKGLTNTNTNTNTKSGKKRALALKRFNKFKYKNKYKYNKWQKEHLLKKKVQRI